MSKTSTPIVKPTITYGALVGQVILNYRKRTGVDQVVIAKALGITQSAYSRLEKGQSAMNLTQLRVVAGQFGVASSDLLTEADTLAARLRFQGVEVTDAKLVSPGAILVALGILAAILASGK